MQNTFNGGSSRGRGGGPYQGNRGGTGGGGMRGGRGRGGTRYSNGPQRSSSPDNEDYDLFNDKGTPSPPPSYSDRNRRGNRNQVNSYRGRNDERNSYSIRGINTNSLQRSFSPTGSYSRPQPQQLMIRRQPSPQGRRSPPPSRYPPQRFENSVNNRRGRSPSPPRINNYSNERAQQQQQSSSRNQNDEVAERLLRRIEENEQDVRALEEQLSRARRRLDESYHDLQQHRRSTEQSVMSCQTIEINSIEFIEETSEEENVTPLTPQINSVIDYSNIPSTSTDPNYNQIEDLNKEDQQEEEEDMQNLTNQLKKTTFAPIQPTYSSDKLTEVAEKLKPAVITNKNRVSILTNYWDINVQSTTVYRYDVDVNVVLNTNDREKTVSLTEGSKTASSRVEHHQLCLAALRAGLEAYSAFRQRAATVYDCVTQLYTSEELEMEGSGSITIEVSPQQLNLIQHRFSDISHIRITISPNQSLPSFDPSDYSKENRRDLSENNKIVSNFLNMLTNESAQRNGLTVFGSGRLFDMEKAGEKIGNGQEKRMGIDKGIKFIEGGVSSPRNNNKKTSNDKNTVPALLLDAKCGIFFSRQSLLATLTAKFGNLNLDWKEIDKQVKSESHQIRNAKWVEIQQYSKGLRFERTYSTKRTFTISGISEQPIKNITFTGVDGKQARVLDYLKSTIGEEVATYNGNLPAVEVRKYDPVNHKTSTMYFAMESIVLTENQRVPISKQTEPPRPIKPQERWGRINQLIGELNLEQGGKRNEIMRMFGVSLSETPKKVIGVKRDAPKVIFANEKHVDIGPQRHDWKSFDCQAILPAQTKAVIVSYPKKDEGIARQAKDALVRKCQQNGLKIEKWHMIDIDRFKAETPHKKILELFDYVAREQSFGSNPLILFLDWESSKSHDTLKLAERRSKVVSQQVTMEKARMLIKQSMTCANVVKKMNIKLGGLNYRVDPESFAQSKWLGKEPILIISYDVAHPGRVNKNEAVVVPSVVGFAFNGGFHQEAFVGDYHFQYPKMEQVDSNILTKRIKWMLQSFIQYRKCWPTKILVIRDGVSEGQYEMVLRDELEALKEGCREFGNVNKKPDWCPPFGLVIATKRHSTRLFKERNGGVENCQPGTVVDRDIVRPVIGDAFIVSAHALQGTARPVCYSILKNEIGLKDMDEFESIMLGLTFHHQITDSPISLPEPVYQADEWAKRGNNMWKAFDKNYDIPKVKGEIGKPNHADFEKMTEFLAIWQTSLSGKRVNA